MAGPLLSLASLSWLGAVGLLLLHVYQWAKYGAWATYRTVQLLYFTGAREWATFPSDWLGVHALLSWLPLWLFFFMLGLVLAIAAVASDP